LIEIKSTSSVNDSHTRSVERFMKDVAGAVGYVFSLDNIPKKSIHIHFIFKIGFIKKENE